MSMGIIRFIDGNMTPEDGAHLGQSGVPRHSPKSLPHPVPLDQK